MDIKRLIVTISIIIISSACNAEIHAFKEAKEETLFKNITLSLCLGMGYEGKSSYFTDQFSTATNGYREFSNVSLDAYDELRALIKIWLKKDYISKSSSQNILMKCIDLSNSSEIKSLYEKYDPCKSSESWLDNKEYKVKCNK